MSVSWKRARDPAIISSCQWPREHCELWPIQGYGHCTALHAEEWINTPIFIGLVCRQSTRYLGILVFFTGSICSEFSMAWVILDMHTWDEINKYDLIRVREYWPEIKAFSFSTQFAYVLVLICRKLRRFVTRKTTHAGFLPFWQIWKHGSLSWQKETH